MGGGGGCCVLGPRLPLGRALEPLTIGLGTTSRVGEIKPSSKVESVLIFNYLPTRSVTTLEFWYLTFIEKKWLSQRQFSKGWLNKKIFRFITLQLIFALFFNLAFIWGQLVANRRANIRQYSPSASNFVLRIFGGNKPLKSLFSIFIIHLNSYLKQEKHVWASRITQFRKTQRINKICDESKMSTFLH